MSSATGPVACGLLLAAVGLYFAPDRVTSSVHGTVTDCLRPGQIVARHVLVSFRDGMELLATETSRAQQCQIEKLNEQLRLEQAHSMALQVRLAQATDDRERSEATPEPLRSLPRLMTTSMIEAQVLGDALAELWRAGKLLNKGDVNGIRESSIVVQSSHPLVDLGRDANLSPEDAILLGRCVIGKIGRVGKWTSTCILLTDSEFRGRAQLVRPTDSGYAFGAKGILKGQGEPLCRLEGISTSESVAVGDAVYTTNRDNLASTRLYFGRVTEATVGPDDKHWNVLVEPVALPHDLRSVQVLRTAINPERVTASTKPPLEYK